MKRLTQSTPTPLWHNGICKIEMSFFFFFEVLRLLNSETPELDLVALPVLLKIRAHKKMIAQLSGKGNELRDFAFGPFWFLFWF